MEIKAAIYHYCNYQERCHAEVRNKLYEIGCTTPEVEEQIAALISAGLLNEERYARAFARGHFRMKQWGKQKIIHHLRRNKISAYCIRKALSEIDQEEYEMILRKLTLRKWTELRKEKNINIRRSKVYRYLLQKGFESVIIENALNEALRN